MKFSSFPKLAPIGGLEKDRFPSVRGQQYPRARAFEPYLHEFAQGRLVFRREDRLAAAGRGRCLGFPRRGCFGRAPPQGKNTSKVVPTPG